MIVEALMVYVTGDTHGSLIERLNSYDFPQGKDLTFNDTIIICGDFGGIWDRVPSRAEDYMADWVEDKHFTVAFCDGNHENFDRLEKFPVIEWNGGKVHQIGTHIFHLMRGEVYTIEGKKFFVFGGAPSHDIWDGVLDPEKYDGYHSLRFKRKYNQMRREGKVFRVKGYSWWPQEVASKEEMDYGLRNLEANDNKIDFIISHDGPASSVALYSHGRYKPEVMSLYLELVRQKVNYDKWYFGHYHDNKQINEKDVLLYENIIRII